MGVTVDYRRSRIVLPYMHREMTANARSREVEQIRQLNQSALNNLAPSPTIIVAGGAKAEALLRWKRLVQTGARWDHKPILQRMLGLTPNDRHFPIERDSQHEYFYDIWSNIHYGYVGMAASFTEAELQMGHQVGGSAGRTDQMDVETVQIGIDLWSKFGLRLSQLQLQQAILDRRSRMLGIQSTPAYRSAVGQGFRHITPIVNGR